MCRHCLRINFWDAIKATPESASESILAAGSDFSSICLGMSTGVTVITTGEQLLDEARAGARDIEVQAHLDLRGLRWHVRPPLFQKTTQLGLKELLYSRGDLRSLRVRAFTTCACCCTCRLAAVLIQPYAFCASCCRLPEMIIQPT